MYIFNKLVDFKPLDIPVININLLHKINQDSQAVIGMALEELHHCVVCLDGEEGGDFYHSRCGHATHRQCLLASIQLGNYTCPLCRQPLGDISVELATVEKRLHRYVKMLKSGLAPSAVRQRMTVDGIPSTLIDAFFTGGTSRALGNETPEQLSVRTEAELQALYQKYQKMLDMGMPEGAVRQKMNSSDSFVSKEIDDFFFKLK